MRPLVPGGTGFVGRAGAEPAPRRGWEVTVLHRGRHGPPAGVRSLYDAPHRADVPRPLETGPVGRPTAQGARPGAGGEGPEAAGR
ncbi:hypothetical protein GCM10009549_09220 [Streptomyces thermoalcalitolerans]|uniref:NAD-dependent epimerase/dehydratase domain-containing protein n=1 Tax=Streptomyces thermoalcalitolerans TaxID=65605 RepID=A0ABN1NF73_9ACTN